MSEQGWHGFLAAQGVEDWVVLHGRATAVFRVGSLGEAARLAEAVAKVPGLEGSGALLALADAGLTVRLSRDLWQLVSRARARQGAARGSDRCRRPYRGRVACTVLVDARGPRGQPRLYLRVARWVDSSPVRRPQIADGRLVFDAVSPPLNRTFVGRQTTEEV